MPLRIAIIGSFRQHYSQVLRAHRIFSEAGYVITSPKGDPVIKPGIPFVRFTSDPEDAHDPMVQTVALHRILGSDLVYVVSPNGYIGRTTCYEIGRIVQAQRPIFFSEPPKDLPVLIPDKFISSAETLVGQLQTSQSLCGLFECPNDDHSRLEWDLLHGNYREI